VPHAAEKARLDVLPPKKRGRPAKKQTPAKDAEPAAAAAAAAAAEPDAPETAVNKAASDQAQAQVRSHTTLLFLVRRAARRADRYKGVRL
jgi:hypothetical protein